MLHVLICALGSDDLLDLCLDSLAKFAGGNYAPHVLYLPLNTTDPAEHGRTIDGWRQQMQRTQVIRDDDVVVIMDPDVALLSSQWRVELERAFADPKVAIWGAGAKEDFGPRVHASMMALRGAYWNERWALNYTFEPCRDPRERTWRDTGGLICMWAQATGWKVQPLERGPDWHGVSAWWGMHTYPALRMFYGSPIMQPIPLWAHLGGGTHSDPERMTRVQRLLRWRQVQRRQRFIAAVRVLLDA